MEKFKDKPAPKKSDSKKKAKNAESGSTPSQIEVNPELETRLSEAAGKPAVFTFGRMNPPTVGHEKLVKKVEQVAKQSNGMPHVFLSHSSDKKKNPLEYSDKIRLATKAFGKSITKSRNKTVIDVMKELQRMGHKDVTMVVGSDRVKDFDTLLNKYNGTEYNFDSINVVSAGERDPDAEGVSGMSASKMREVAKSGDVSSFKTGLPSKLKGSAKLVMDLVRAGMQVAEELEEIDNELVEALLDEKTLTLQQRRKRGQVMRRYKTKIARARERAKKRMAGSEKLKTRARRHAIQLVRRRFAGQKGADYSKLAAGEKIQIDRRIEKKKALIDKIAKRLLPKERKAEIERLKKSKTSVKEDVNESFDAMMIEDSMTPQWLRQLVMAPKMKKMVRGYLNWRKKNPGQGQAGVQQVIKMMGLSPRDGNQLIDTLNKMVAKGDLPKHLAIQEQDDHVDRTKEKHKVEKERLKRKHDSEMDRARLRDTKKANMAEQSLFDTVDALMEFINHENAYLLSEKSRASLKSKAEKSGIPYTEIKKVYDAGVSEWIVSESNMTAEQAGYALVNKFIAEGGLWDNIHKKRERIKKGSGEKMRKPGSKGAPTAQNFKDAQEEGGAGEEGTDKLVRRYKKDTPVSEQTSLDESFEGLFGGTWAKPANPIGSYLNAWDQNGLYQYDEDEEIDLEEDVLEEAEHEGRKVTLNKPFRTPGGPKKFAVYTRNDKGNVVKVTFGDPNMEIKRDDPARRRSFRARHNCDNPGPKWKARYWSCKKW